MVVIHSTLTGGSRAAGDAIWGLSEELQHVWDSQEPEEAPSVQNADEWIDWVGDHMGTRGPSTGARIATLNTYRKFMPDEQKWEVVYKLMRALDIDILVLTEPGKADEMRTATLKEWAIDKQMSVEMVNRSNRDKAGGIVIITAHQWAGVKRKVTTFAPKTTDRDRVFAVEYDNGVQGDHNKLLLIGYYGLNASNTKKKQLKEMHEFVWKVKSQFKRRCWRAPVVLAGDINAARSTRHDTDREALGDGQEADAGTLEHLETLGFHDPLRDNHPNTRIVTRRPGKSKVGTMRYLDRILMTTELSEHMDTRVGVYQRPIFSEDDTDHMMVVADIPVDVAAVAKERAELWDTHKTVRQVWDSNELGNMAPEKVEAFNEAATATIPQEVDAGSVTKWLTDAGKGSVLRTSIREYPRAVRKLKDYQTKDWMIRQNVKLLRETLKRVEDEHVHPTTAFARLSKLRNVCNSPHATIAQEYSGCTQMNRETAVIKLVETMITAKEYLKRENRKHRAREIKENVDRRNRRFEDKHKKSLRAVITSIMRRDRVNEQITACVRESGIGIATTAKEVAREVTKFYKEWMRSKVAWSQRWRTWEGMMHLRTEELTNKDHAAFVEGAYRESYEKFGEMQRTRGIWNRVWDKVDLQTIKKALQKFKSGKAGGPSGVTYDLLKALDDTNLGPIVHLMQTCLDNRRLPIELNRSMIRALPKTDGGLADLNLTRPIALMESLGKLFERILFMRIVDVMTEEDMLDLGQHGGSRMGGEEHSRPHQDVGRGHGGCRRDWSGASPVLSGPE